MANDKPDDNAITEATIAASVKEETAAGAEQAPAEDKRAQNMVTVRAVRSFHDSAVNEFKNPKSEPYQVTRQRAAELFANDLVEYVDQADEDAEIDADEKADAEASKSKAAARRANRKK